LRCAYRNVGTRFTGQTVGIDLNLRCAYRLMAHRSR